MVLFLAACISFNAFLYADESRTDFCTQVVVPGKSSTLEYKGVSLEIPAGAVDKDVEITVAEIASFENGSGTLRNVTSGSGSYRFTPSGFKFKKNIQVSIPFDRNLLKSETALSNLFTYFLNETTGRWERLPRVRVDREKGVVVSLTDHFTDMINAVLVIKEGPDQPDSDINNIKNLKAADPATRVTPLTGLVPDSSGNASFKIPLNIPAGRGGAVPQLALEYNSGSVNSWMGRGFDIPVPSISTDTRFGLPEYDGKDTYILEGKELVPVSSSSSDTRYRMRVEKEFKRILRHRETGYDYWEVTDKSGNIQFFGSAGNNENGWVGPDREQPSKVYIWYLTRVIDANGNTVTYSYDYDEENKYTCLKEIRYSGWTDGTSTEEGKYLVSFRTSGERPDRRSDCRGGFFSKLTRRLDGIDVSFNGEVFRRYLFAYRQNEFGQTVLERFTEQDGSGNNFYSYAFDYKALPVHRDEEGNPAGYEGFGENTVTWAAVPETDFPGIDRSISYGVGASLYAGVKFELYTLKNWKFSWTTVFDIGVSGGVNVSNTITGSTLLDINGDMLPDAVWKDGGSLKAYRNTGSGFDTSSVMCFSGVPALLNQSTQRGYFLGASAGLFGVRGAVTLQRNWIDGKTSFCDINGDGFTDFVLSDYSSFYRNSGSGFADTSYGSGGASMTAESAVDEDSFLRTYSREEPVRKWKAFTGGEIEIGQRAEIIDSERIVSGAVRAVTYPAGGVPAYSIDLMPGQTAGENTRIFPVKEGDEFYFLMDTGADTRGKELNWNVDIRYKKICYFEDMEKTPAASEGEDDFIPVRIPEDLFILIFDRASDSEDEYDSSGNITGVIPGGKAKMIDGYQYRPEFGDFLRINGSADDVVRALIVSALTEEQRLELYYYTDFIGSRIHPGGEDHARSFVKEAPDITVEPILLKDMEDAAPGDQSFTKEILLDRIYTAGGMAEESLFLQADEDDEGTYVLFSQKDGIRTEAAGAEVVRTENSIWASCYEDGIKHSFVLSNPDSVLHTVPRSKYDNELLEAVTADFSFTQVSYKILSPDKYTGLINKITDEDDKDFISSLYIPYPEDSDQTEYYTLPEGMDDGQYSGLVIILDRLSDDPDSALDRPVLSEESGSFGIVALSEDEYGSYFSSDPGISSLFDEITDAEGNSFYVIKDSLAEQETALLEEAEKRYIRDEIEFPYYRCDAEKGDYVLRENLPSEAEDEISSVFKSLGWRVFTLLERSLEYFSNSELPVIYGEGAFSDSGTVYIPYFNDEGRTALTKRLIHHYNSEKDFSPDNLIVYPERVYNKDDTRGASLFEDTESGDTPEGFEVFSGGVNGWYYGSWCGYYPFNSSLIREHPPESGEEETSYPGYFTAMVRNMDDEGSVEVAEIGKGPEIFLSTRSLLGGVSSYTDSGFDDNGNPVNTSYWFASLIEGDMLHADRKGGDTYYNIPRGSSPVSGGRIGKISAGRSESTDINGSVPVVFADLGFSKNSGVSWQSQRLMDINGDRYPDLIVYPQAKEGSRGFSVAPGTGAGFSDVYGTSSPVKHLSYSRNTTYAFGAYPGSGIGAVAQRFSPEGEAEETSVSAPDKSSGGSLGLSGFNGTAGSSVKTEDFIDINGDGLPDHVRREGSGPFSISFNAGISGFTPEVSFGPGADANFYEPGSDKSDLAHLSEGLALGNSGSLGTGAYLSIPGAALMMGFNASAGRTLYKLMDINGDGLVDQVSKHPGEVFFRVRFNLGDSFSAEDIKIYKPEWGISFADIPVVIETLLENSSSSMDSIDIPMIDQSGVSRPSSLTDASSSPFADVINPIRVDDSITYKGGISISLGANLSLMWGLNLGLARFGFTLIPGVNGFYAVSTTNITMQDINGDGLPDHVLKKTGDSPVLTEINSMGKAGLLKKIVLPAGGSISLEYGRRGNTVAMPGSRYVLEKVTRRDGYENTPEMEGEHSYSESIEYSGGYYDRAERKFYGFDEVKTTKADGSVITVSYENRDYYTRGLIQSIQVEDENGKIFIKKENTYTTTQTGSGIHTGTACQATLLSEERSRTYDPEDGDYLETAKEYTYDSYGNVTRYIDRGDKNNLYDDIILEIKYRDPGNAYLANLPESMEVTSSSGKLLRKREGTYDAKGNLLALKNYYRENDSSDYTFEYDTYGNMTSVEDPLRLREDYHYDSEVHSYVTEITVSNPSYPGDSYTSHISYDYRYDVETSGTDINSNTVTKEYDNFGRLTRVRSPYDTGEIPALQYTYHTDTFPWKSVTRNKISFNLEDMETMDTCVIIDGLNRVLTTAKEGEVYEGGDTKYGWSKSGFIVYDSKGRAVQEGQRVFEEITALPVVETTPVRPSVKTFDILDRIKSITLPDGSIMENSYEIDNGRYKERTTDPLGNITERFKDIRQNIVEIIQKDSSSHPLTRASYSYSVLGELLEVQDAKGNTVNFNYDLKGRRIAIESAETGRTDFTYDEADHLVRKVDANLRNRGKMINYLYDPLGRLEKVDYPFMKDTLYTYGSSGASNNSAGRITRIEDESGSTENYYGKLGETTTVIKRINRLTPFPETKEAAFHYLFDYQGRMESITYPDGEEVKYTYNRGGEVVSIKGEHNGFETTYVENTRYDEYGQIVFLRLGNGVETTYTYDENRRWLKTIHTRNTFLTLQNSSYTFDRAGNILSIQNESDRYTSSQNYTYDGLYQLVKGEGTFVDREHGYVQETNKYTQNFTYDTIGNILRKKSTNTSTLGIPGSGLTYDDEYAYFTDKPKQVERAGNMYYLYDSNGNIMEERWGGHSTGGVMGSGSITKTGDVSVLNRGIGLIRETAEGEGEVYKRSYTWDEENRLKSTVDGNHNVSYRYDYSGRRTNKKETNGNETLYFNSLWLETEDSPSFRQSKNIYLGETRIATRLNLENEPSTGYERVNTYYYHPDHLGSSNIVTDYEGEVYEHVEYTPYGEEWIEKGNDQLKKIPYRFNAKELDEETGLYYYGARYLNPKTSRWISADPAMDGINWYAYANNNPIKYTDPAGLAPRNMTDTERNAYKQSIKDTDPSSIPSNYDCADVGAYLASKAMGDAKGEENYYKNLEHKESKINNIQDIQAKDFQHEGNNISFYKDKDGKNDRSFNSGNIEVGTIGVFGAKEGATWTGHIITVTKVKKDKKGNILSINTIEGTQTDVPSPHLITPNAFKDYIENTGPFLGWGEIGSGSALVGNGKSSNPNEGVIYNGKNK